MTFMNKASHKPKTIDIENDELIPLGVIFKRHGRTQLYRSSFHRWTHERTDECRLDVALVDGIWVTTDSEFVRWLRFRDEEKELHKIKSTNNLLANRRRTLLLNESERDALKPKRVMMRLVDSGGDTRYGSGRFECGQCGHQSDWIILRTAQHAMKGHPCPKCKRTTR